MFYLNGWNNLIVKITNLVFFASAQNNYGTFPFLLAVFNIPKSGGVI